MKYIIALTLLISACAPKSDSDKDNGNNAQNDLFPVSTYLLTRKAEFTAQGGEALYLSEFQGSLDLYYGGGRALYDSCMVFFTNTGFIEQVAEECAQGKTPTPKENWGW